MNVILLDKLVNLGDLGDEVTVKPGYARNFLLPQGKAVQANAANREVFEARRQELEEAADTKRGEAEQRATKLDDLSVTLVVKAGEEGKLYGSVGTQDIADALIEAGADVTRAEVRMPDGVIRATGEYEVVVQLHSEVSRNVQVIVAPE